MEIYRTRFGTRTLIGLVGLCALLFWAIKVSRDSRPSNFYSKWLSDGDGPRRAHAAQELGNSDVDPAVAVPALLRALRADGSAIVRERAVRSIIQLLRDRGDASMVEDVTGPFVAALADEAPAVRTAAADALGQAIIQLAKARGDVPTTGAQTGPLVGALADGDPAVRTAADRALERFASDASGRIGPKYDGSLPGLLRAFRDQDERVRGAAIGSIGVFQKYAAVAPEPRRAIAEALNDPSEHVRELAIYAFWAAAEKSPAFSVALLRDEGTPARRGALRALARNSILAGAVVPELTAALADPDPGVRAGAAKALRIVRPLPPPAIVGLKQAQSDRDEAVRKAAAEALWGVP